MTQLRIEGEVSSPHTFSFSDLTRLPGQIADVGQLVPGRDGGGIRLRSLLERVSPADSARYITLESSDGKFSASLPITAVHDAISPIGWGMQSGQKRRPVSTMSRGARRG